MYGNDEIGCYKCIEDYFLNFLLIETFSDNNYFGNCIKYSQNCTVNGAVKIKNENNYYLLN